MKKIIKLLLVLVGFSFASCQDYLSVEKYFHDMLDMEDVFASKTYSEKWLYNVYSELPLEFANRGSGGTNFPWASDECFYGDWSQICEFYQNCEYSASNQGTEDRWADMYEGIRKASIFIHNILSCEELTLNERYEMQGEARFLRGYFYYLLIKQYGPVPIMPDEGVDVSASYSDLAYPRNTMEECVDFIDAELTNAAQLLPELRSSAWMGRATRGAALAIRAKVLIFAASPLYNGNADMYDLVDGEGNRLINDVYSEEKWARAAAAAKEVINMGTYELFVVSRTDDTVAPAAGVPELPFPDGAADIDPFESYRQLFNGEWSADQIPEFIYAKSSTDYYGITSVIKSALPISSAGLNTVAVTQKQVEAYYMGDGQTIYESSDEYPYIQNSDGTFGFTTSATEVPFLPTGISYMYAYREPRFYASIGYNGAIWENNTTTTSSYKNVASDYYKEGTDGKTLASPSWYVRTGTGMKKYYHPDDSSQTGGSFKTKALSIVRYADVLLWYAEALNELTEGASYSFTTYTNTKITVNRDIDEMRYAFSRVRFRAGLPDLSDAVYNDKSTFRSVIKRERQIEFFCEGVRYFDLRRWKDAPDEEGQLLMGLNLDMKGTDDEKALFYNVVPADMDKVWLDKMYFWPIPTSELTKNSNMTQNPGW